jgi:tRNA(adenine34) deaminase
VLTGRQLTNQSTRNEPTDRTPLGGCERACELHGGGNASRGSGRIAKYLWVRWGRLGKLPLGIPSPLMWTQHMDAALAEARAATEHDDVPVGAVLVDPDGSVVASDHNRREETKDPTAHAEMRVLSTAAREAGNWRMNGHTLVVTLEPCAMCAGAAVLARLERIVYGAADPKAGAAWSLFNIPQDRRLNHQMDIVAGVREEECGAILTDFFDSHR